MPRFYIPNTLACEHLTDPDRATSKPLWQQLRKLFEQVRAARQHGYSNQPRVYTFRSEMTLCEVNTILAEAGVLDSHPWFPKAVEKDW